MTQTPNVTIIEEIDEVLGKVERFGTNNTRTVYISRENLSRWVHTVYEEFDQEWVEIAVTPKAPLAAYPQKNPLDSDEPYGIAVAPGLYPEEYEEVMNR